MCARIRSGDASAVSELLERDHSVADLLFRVASAYGTGDDALRSAWQTLIKDVRSGLLTGWLRAALLERVVLALDDRGELDPVPAPALPGRGPFLAEDDRWAGWWAEDPVPWPEGTEPTAAQVRNALRRVPLSLRVLLVVRDVARLPPAQAERIVNRSADRQAPALETARAAYVAYVDEEVARA
jgi:hypothetical protein